MEDKSDCLHSPGTVAVLDSQESQEVAGQSTEGRCPGYWTCEGCPECFDAEESVRAGDTCCDRCGVEFGSYSGQIDQITGNAMSCNCDFDDC